MKIYYFNFAPSAFILSPQTMKEITPTSSDSASKSGSGFQKPDSKITTFSARPSQPKSSPTKGFKEPKNPLPVDKIKNSPLLQAPQNQNQKSTSPAFQGSPQVVKQKSLPPVLKKTPLSGIIIKSRSLFKKISVGAFCDLKVTALGPKGVGIDEFSYGFSIIIPKAQLGETGKAQIKRIFNFKKAKYAVASFVKPMVADNKTINAFSNKKSLENPKFSNLTVGDILTVKLDHIAIRTDSSCIGLANYVPSGSGTLDTGFKPEGNQIIIPLDPQINRVGSSAKVGQEIKIKITRIKFKYAFAQALIEQESPLSLFENQNNQTDKLAKGSKITLTLPKTATKYAKHVVILLKSAAKPYVLFLKNGLGAKSGDKVRVNFSKVGTTFAIGKILRIAPNSPFKKLARVRKNLYEMLINGMHYGEKVIKCQAKMRGYLWNRQKGQKVGSPLPNQSQTSSDYYLTKKRVVALSVRSNRSSASSAKKQGNSLQKGSLLLKGDKKSPVIKKGGHLINLLKTRRCLNIGLNQLTKYAAKGRTFLFVGTKKPAAGLIARAALFSKTSFFVNTRWLGGMLTNWKTIVKSITKIRPILKEKQEVLSTILQKRAEIRTRLTKKILSLKNKSKALMQKGTDLIAKVKSFDPKKPNQTNTNTVIFAGLLMKRKALFSRGQFLLEKRKRLLEKQTALKEKTFKIKESGVIIANKYKVLLNQLTTTHKKLHDIRLIFILNKELRTITKLAKEQGKNQYTLSDEKFEQFSSLGLENDQSLFLENILVKMSSKKLWLIPNPPEEILNKILVTINSLSANNWNSPKNTNLSSAGLSEQVQDRNPSGFANFSVKEKNNTSLPNFKTESESESESEEPFSSDIKKSIVLTQLLSQFSRSLPDIKNAISSMLHLILGMVQKMTELKTHLKNLKTKLSEFIFFNKKINMELKLTQKKYMSEQQIIRVLRRKLKRHQAEKKLLQFLPKLRYLPTPKSTIASAITVLMKRFVDPKMKYPMDLIYDEKLKNKSKKVAAARKRKWQRLETYFGGIANMTKLKKTQISNNVAIIIGQPEEMNAIRECKKLGIKMFHIVDTDCNPSLADHIIPSNDDSRNSIQYILTKIVTRIKLAQKIRLRLKS